VHPMLKVLAIFRRNLILLGVSRYASPLTSDEMSFRIRRITACLLALNVLGLGVERVVAESPRMLAAPPDKDDLRRTGHDAIDVSPAVKRYAGIVTALGAPDRPLAEIDVVDSQLDELGGTKPVSVREEDHRVVPGGVSLALLCRGAGRAPRSW